MKLFLFSVAVLPAALTLAGVPYSYSDHVPLEESKGLSVEEKLEIEKKANLTKHAPGPDWRLPGNLVPTRYDIVLLPDFYDLEPDVWGGTSGSIRYYLLCKNATNKIIMHGKDIFLMDSSKPVMEVGTGRLINVTQVSFDQERDFFTLELDGDLQTNFEYEYELVFVSRIAPNGAYGGLYYERYLDPMLNQSRVILVTQLEPVRARQVFPCFDEPTYKSLFNVTIFYEEGFSALANGEALEVASKKNIESIIPSKIREANPSFIKRELKYDVFNTTAKMPTYLIAFAVKQHYDVAVAPEDLYRLPVRVHGPNHLMMWGAGEFSANTSAKVMTYFESKYEIGYPMEKVDSISIRSKGGAMENYGLVTYGEGLLMHVPTTTSSAQRQIISVIAHELGHQWFGNLVTCKWWSNIWLNEGFASFVSGEAMKALWPEYEMSTGMVEGSNSALKYDAGPRSHPIHQEVYSASEIGSNMDTIAYDKGASLIRMMASFLGEENFYDGIKGYLRAYSNDVAEQNDLFGELEKVAYSLPKAVEEIMNTWTLQKGFPLVRVTLDESGTPVISQEPWQNAENRDRNESVESTWDIPVQYMAEVGPNVYSEGDIWLFADTRSEALPVQLTDDGVLLLNSEAAGYFRTLYDDELKGRILRQLENNHTLFSPRARVRLIDDQLTLGFEKYIPIQDALEFTKYLDKEEDPFVWSTVINHLNKVVNLYRNVQNHTTSDHFLALQSYLLPRVEAVIEKLGGYNGTYERFTAKAILKSQLIDWSCAMESQLCWNQTRRIFYDWWLWDVPYPEDMEETFLCQFVNNQDDDDAVWYISRLITFESDLIRRQRLVSSLACTRDSFEAIRIIVSIAGYPPDYQITRDGSIPVLQRLFTFSEFTRAALASGMSMLETWLPNYYRNDTNTVMQIFNSAPSLLTDTVQLEIIRDAYPEFYGDSFEPIFASVRQNLEWMNEYGTNITLYMESQS